MLSQINVKDQRQIVVVARTFYGIFVIIGNTILFSVLISDNDDSQHLYHCTSFFCA